jgi:hypothetical protein
LEKDATITPHHGHLTYVSGEVEQRLWWAF